MAKQRDTIHAVYDEELESLLKSLGLFHDFTEGKLRCSICHDVITWDNLNAFYPDSGAVKVTCTRPECMAELATKVNGWAP